MNYIVIAAIAFSGYFIGAFFIFPVLVVLTVISLVVGVIMAITNKEIATLFTMMFVYFALWFNVAMWVTYYITTKQTWISQLFKDYLLR